MLAPTCLTSLDRRKTNTKHTVESRRNLAKDILRLILYQEHSLTLDMCKDHCTVAGLWYATLPGLRFLSPLLQSLLPLHHFSRNARKWAVLKSLSKRNEWLVSHTAMRYLPVRPSPSPSPAVPVMVWYTIYNAPYTRGHWQW